MKVPSNNAGINYIHKECMVFVNEQNFSFCFYVPVLKDWQEIDVELTLDYDVSRWSIERYWRSVMLFISGIMIILSRLFWCRRCTETLWVSLCIFRITPLATHMSFPAFFYRFIQRHVCKVNMRKVWFYLRKCHSSGISVICVIITVLALNLKGWC